MNPEQVKTVAEAAQAIFVTLGVIVGGTWAYWTFNSTLQRENAEAVLLKINNEIERHPIINVRLTANCVELDGKYLFVTAELQNTGSAPVVIEVPNTPEEAPVKIAKIVSNNEGRLVVSEDGDYAIMKSVDYISSGSYLAPGKIEYQHYLLRVPAIGMYILQYKIPAPASLVDYAGKMAGKPVAEREKLWIGDSIYIPVSEKCGHTN